VVGDMLAPLGRLRETEALYRDALRRVGTASPAADLHAGLADLLVSRNELAEARQHLETSEALHDVASSREHRYRWFVAMARLAQAEEDPDEALSLLDSAHRHYLRGFFPEARPIGAQQARVWIAQGRLAEARAWAAQHQLTPSNESSYLREFEHLTLARLMIAEHADPTTLLDRLLSEADAAARTGSVIEILVLQALAVPTSASGGTTLAALERALELAEPEGQVRLFLDEGEAILGLLRAASAAGIRPEFVRKLTQQLRPGEPGGEVLADPLSERELQVVRLLATELTGPDIAREIYVSLNTLRTHTRHIFQKLDVNSRPEAVRRAEALGLI